MTKTTRWFPDTCACVVELEWDTQHPRDEAKVVRILSQCAHHPGTDPSAVYEAIRATNRTAAAGQPEN